MYIYINMHAYVFFNIVWVNDNKLTSPCHCICRCTLLYDVYIFIFLGPLRNNAVSDWWFFLIQRSVDHNECIPRWFMKLSRTQQDFLGTKSSSSLSLSLYLMISSASQSFSGWFPQLVKHGLLDNPPVVAMISPFHCPFALGFPSRGWFIPYITEYLIGAAMIDHYSLHLAAIVSHYEAWLATSNN